MQHCCPRSGPTLLLQPQPHHQTCSAWSCRSSVCCHSHDVWWKKPSICKRRAQRTVAARMQRGMCNTHSSKHFPNKRDINVVNWDPSERRGKTCKASHPQASKIASVFSNPKMTPMNPANASFTLTQLFLKAYMFFFSSSVKPQSYLPLL